VWVSNIDLDGGNIDSEPSAASTNNAPAGAAVEAGPPQQEQQQRGRAYDFRLSPCRWTKIYEAVHGPSAREYVELQLDSPVLLYPGEVRAIYIHSRLPGDEAIVYDNTPYHGDTLYGGGLFRQFHGFRPRGQVQPYGGSGPQPVPRYDDKFLSIFTGKAHLSPVPFGSTPIWGWGGAWRDGREFVGRIKYGCLYKLWFPNPELHWKFGPGFRDAVKALLKCQRRPQNAMSMLPDECLHYIVHMCRWDWFQDDARHMKQHKRLLKAKKKQREAQNDLERTHLQEYQTSSHAAMVGSSDGDHGSCCRLASSLSSQQQVRIGGMKKTSVEDDGNDDDLFDTADEGSAGKGSDTEFNDANHKLGSDTEFGEAEDGGGHENVRECRDAAILRQEVFSAISSTVARRLNSGGDDDDDEDDDYNDDDDDGVDAEDDMDFDEGSVSGDDGEQEGVDEGDEEDSDEDEDFEESETAVARFIFRDVSSDEEDGDSESGAHDVNNSRSRGPGGGFGDSNHHQRVHRVFHYLTARGPHQI
jgi:hypothetical protein